MTTQQQKREQAEKEIFAVCERLYEDGICDPQKFSIRRIREGRKEMFGHGAHQDLISYCRKVWLTNKGMLQPEIEQESLSNTSLSEPSSTSPQWMQNVFESFLLEQQKAIEAKVYKSFESKIADLELMLHNSKEQAELAEEKLQEALESNSQKQLQIDGFGSALVDLTTKVQTLAEEKTSAIQELKSVNLECEKLRDEKKGYAQLKIKFNQLNDSYKHLATQRDEANKAHDKLKKENTKLALKVEELARVKQSLEHDYQHALRDIKRHEQWRQQEIEKDEKAEKIRAKFEAEKYNAIVKTLREEIEKITCQVDEADSKRIARQASEFVALNKSLGAIEDALSGELRQVKSTNYDLKQSITTLNKITKEFTGRKS